jgi:replicative DNA helicase
MASPLTPLELAERALVGALLWQPGRVTEIARWLDPEDFRHPVNGAVFRYVRDMVAEATTAPAAPERTATAYTIYHAQYDTGRQHSRLIAESLEIFQVSREPFPEGLLASIRSGTGLGYDVHEHSVTVPADTPDTGLVDAVADAIRNEPDFNFFDEVIGDDIVEGGVVYSADAYVVDPEDGVREMTAAEHADHVAELERRDTENEAQRYAVNGVTADAVLARMVANGDVRDGRENLNGPYLHTLMHTAPTPRGRQPEIYALYVAEAAVRRDLDRGGMRVAQVGEANLELVGLLSAVETALNQVNALQQRWRSVSGDRAVASTITRGLAEGGGPIEVPRVDPDSITSGLDVWSPAPDEQTLRTAEESVLGHVLLNPALIGDLVDRLLPEDFADTELGNAFRAAVALHGQPFGPEVDAVTVAWEQQRQSPQHGPGAAVQRLMDVQDRTPLGSPSFAVDIVMRAALARMISHAASSARQAAQHPGLQPSDVLHTTQLAYEAVRTTADRMTGQASTASRMTGIATVTPEPGTPVPPPSPAETTLPMAPVTLPMTPVTLPMAPITLPLAPPETIARSAGRSVGQAAGWTRGKVTDLRARTAGLLSSATGSAPGERSNAQVPDLASRLRGDLTSRIGQNGQRWPSVEHDEPTPDYGPEL